MGRKSNTEQPLEWNVIVVQRSSGNGQINFNIFQHQSFLESVLNLAKEKDYETFQDKLRHTAMYYFWSKYEYEILVADLCDRKEVKIDVYYQLKLNWDKFSKYVWERLRK